MRVNTKHRTSGAQIVYGKPTDHAIERRDIYYSQLHLSTTRRWSGAPVWRSTRVW